MNYPQQQPVYRPANYGWTAPTIPQVRPVSSVEEVRASSIDFDGSIFYFPDIANRKIYTKFVNLDGTVSINIYELKQADQPIESSYVTRQEFDEVIKKFESFFGQKEIS